MRTQTKKFTITVVGTPIKQAIIVKVLKEVQIGVSRGIIRGLEKFNVAEQIKKH